MKYLFINSVAGSGSTGRIAADKCRELQAQGHECVIAYGRWEANCQDVPTHQIGTAFDYKIHGVLTRVFDLHGFGSKRATKKFLQWADGYDPDVVWLHNIHGYYINIEMLFAWIKKRPQMQVKWTLHDCWAFTGHCGHFTMVQCTQWQTHCRYCKQLRRYPKCYTKGNVRRNFNRKRAAFTGVQNMTLVTPSQWLADLAKQSFLKEYPVNVIYNTIDTNVFKPSPSDFRERYGLQNKTIVLGVASVWEERKGLYDFVKLSELLDSSYVIVLVGLNEKQMQEIPATIIGIARTESPQQLAEIYTAADVFVNPTYEDNYPTVNLEAQACGTPVITYDTGGSKETLKQSGSLVEQGDIQEIADKIKELRK